jgi:hypothetical protein
LNRSIGSSRCPSAETIKSFSVIGNDLLSTGRETLRPLRAS